jgi:hypothetical protein
MASKSNSWVSSTSRKMIFTLFIDTITLFWEVDVVVPLLVLFVSVFKLRRFITVRKRLLRTVPVVVLVETNLWICLSWCSDSVSYRSVARTTKTKLFIDFLSMLLHIAY